MKAAIQGNKRPSRWWLALAALALLALAAWWIASRPALPLQAAPAQADTRLVARGANLARLGMCAACHTVDAARPYAGGLPIDTPFGTVYSTNITPDARTGIGGWSEAAFTRSMRQGVSRDGHLLYPAFPYNHYTQLAQDDIRALYAYVMTRPALHAPARENRMTFPFGWRPLLAFWNLLYLDESPWRDDPRQPAQWNRGAYVANTLAHCSACHTPRTLLGGPDLKRRFDGGDAGNWYAPALNATSPSPVPWTREHLATYLRTGLAPGHAIAGGPMQDVVRNLGQADAADVAALSTYIHGDLAQAPARAAPAAGPLPAPAANDSDLERMRLGHAMYAMACASCHDAGRGASSGAALQLQQAVALYDPDPRSLVRIIRDGIAPPEGEPGRQMPGFATMMNDAQVVALAAYLRRYGAQAEAWPELEQTVQKAKQP
ncbi:c-type cytochrome [Massilia yuzhufengensis]|uniref:Cytochrome c, mono-and diheme variants n=1 Tax=Massilia yuzhufengensis TaxID=1164594 RepID=A0A1I1I621_9BURK|nr:c-type cytochrome [Massilia yuzhufengensis]SFC31475.1 Cytochrome c, mono-and diheme variants [Massilia yuzhufengensis]